MEQHAVPQDITGFKFKLVGDMTLKQFGELAFGAVMAYLFYASGWPIFLKWPLAIGFAIFGIALAFLPIEERPLDVWIINFFRAIYRPTYYVWEKGAVSMSFRQPPAVTERPPTPAGGATPPPSPQAGLTPWPFPKEKKEETPAATTAPAPTPPPAAPAPTQPALSVEELVKMREQKLAELAGGTKAAPLPTEEAAAKVVTIDELSRMRQEVLAKKQGEEKATESIPLTSAAEKAATAGVRFLAEAGKSGITLTDKPNVVNGMVVDWRGAPMDGVVLVVKDEKGNPIRALKTNKIGQFMVSTPLPDGKYYVELERPGYTFDVLEMTLAGQVLPPLQVIAKKEAMEASLPA